MKVHRLLLLSAAPLLVLAACDDAHGHDAPHFPGVVPDVPAIDPEQVQLAEPPPLSEGIFPCSDCHDPDALEPNAERRELDVPHDEIVLRHDEEHRWCLDCHDRDDRDHLHLASGELVPFEKSYRLCGQCHGDKYRDWLAGVHGRRTGSWRDPADQKYLLCVNCHNSHAPRFAPLAPKPSPLAPEVTR